MSAVKKKLHLAPIRVTSSAHSSTWIDPTSVNLFFTVLLRWDSLFLLVLLFHPGMSLRSINLLPLINEDTAPWNYPPEFQNFLKIQHLQCVIYHLTECFEPLIHMTKSSQIEGASVMLLHADMSANLTLHL